MTAVPRSLIDKHFGDWEHPYQRFEREVATRLQPGATLLDIGCGRDAPVLRKFVGRQLRLIGIDTVGFPNAIEDIELLPNDVTASGLPDNSIDVAMARSVMEHVVEPYRAYQEIFRILKPGGHFIFLTANSWDYASLIARAVPNRWHPWIVRRVEGRAEEDVFPTAYKSNTRRQIQRLARDTGLRIDQFEYLGQYPSYFLFSEPLFLAATAYEKMLARFPFLHCLRGWILAVLRRPPG